MHEDFKDCESCNFNFMVVWTNDGCGPPEYCPRCGEKIDYD